MCLLSHGPWLTEQCFQSDERIAVLCPTGGRPKVDSAGLSAQVVALFIFFFIGVMCVCSKHPVPSLVFESMSSTTPPTSLLLALIRGLALDRSQDSHL